MRPLIVCLFVLCSGLANAQEGRKINCRFLCCDGAEPPPPLVNVSAKGAEIACSVPPNTFSAPIVCYVKGDAISFLTASDLKPLATAAIAAKVKAAILVFAPAEKAPGTLPWRISVIEDFPADFPDGGTLVANLCSQDARFTIGGDDPVILQTGQTHTFACPKSRDDFNTASVLFEFHQETIWRTSNESRLRFAPGMRYLLYAYPDAASARPRLATCQDIPPAKAKPKK